MERDLGRATRQNGEWTTFLSPSHWPQWPWLSSGQWRVCTLLAIGLSGASGGATPDAVLAVTCVLPKTAG